MDSVLPQEAQAPRSHRRLIALIFIIIAILISPRFSPRCFFSAGKAGWNTWARVYPNLACSLDLHAQQIPAEELNARLGSFTNITRLNLSDMHLAKAPATIASLAKLTTITLSKNLLTDIPDEVASLPLLTTLDLSSNSITEVPPSFGGSSHLTSLDLSDNAISSVPSFLNSSSFSSLSLGQNPLPSEEQGGGEEQSSAAGGSSSVASSPSSHASVSSASEVSSAGISSSHSSVDITSSSAQQSFASSASFNGSSADSLTSLSSSSSSGISFPSSASSGNSSVNSSEQSVSCVRNFSINGYSMCIPSSWTVHEVSPLHVNLLDGSTLAAKVTCPMEQVTYDEWQVTLRSRTFQKDGHTYGADELSGTNDAGELGFLMVLMHKHDFNSWFGDNYSDVPASCQLESMRPLEDANAFRFLYLSIQ